MTVVPLKPSSWSATAMPISYLPTQLPWDERFSRCHARALKIVAIFRGVVLKLLECYTASFHRLVHEIAIKQIRAQPGLG